MIRSLVLRQRSGVRERKMTLTPHKKVQILADHYRIRSVTALQLLLRCVLGKISPVVLIIPESKNFATSTGKWKTQNIEVDSKIDF